MRMAARLEAMGVEKYAGLTRKSGGRSKWTGTIHLDHGALTMPERWKRPRRVFVNSMSDLFHPAVPDDFVAAVWDSMAATSRHTFQILTKRPDRMRAIISRFPRLPHVWLGTSIEDHRVLHRIDELRAITAAVRFLSFEPLIGSVADANLAGIDWAIVGGESGPDARPLNPKWIDEVHERCLEAGTAFFFKQWGGKNKKASGRIYRGRLWDDLPDARI